LGAGHYTRVKSILCVHIVPEFGSLFLYDVAPQKFAMYQKKRREHGASNASLNREFSALRDMLTTAVEWKRIKANGLQGVKKLKEPPGRNALLTMEQIHRLIDCCAEHLRPIVLMALCTGMRKDEILGLKWDWVKLEHRIILLPDSKTHEARMVPINKTLAAMLEAMPSREGYVFGNGKRYENVRKSFLSACKAAGITNFRFHDLRHCFASHLALKGVNTRMLMDLLGHKTMAMSQRYTHIPPAALQSAVGLLDALVGEPQA